MVPFLPSIIAGGASLIGGLLQNSAQRHSAKEAMRFSERMSNTAYRRMVKDMRAAGINPILGFGSGGASTPQGIQAQIGNPFGEAVNSAVSARREEINARANQVAIDRQAADSELTGRKVQLANDQRKILAQQLMRMIADNVSAKQAGKFAGSIGQLGPLVNFLMQLFQKR